MTEQLAEWTGEFGEAYTDRNQVDWHTRVDTLKKIVPADVATVLEVGCNRGHNLLALQHLGMRVYGTEPATYARKLATDQMLYVCPCSVYEIADNHSGFDLVFTSGVLTHVPPAQLDGALRNLVAASRRYVLAIEYGSASDQRVSYRGHTDMLWKRNYGERYTDLFPDLTLVDVGELGRRDGFDRSTWWLLEK